MIKNSSHAGNKSLLETQQILSIVEETYVAKKKLFVDDDLNSTECYVE